MARVQTRLMAQTCCRESASTSSTMLTTSVEPSSEAGCMSQLTVLAWRSEAHIALTRCWAAQRTAERVRA